ncbi:DNA internalization-related competence protein ComEC/Rec2 [Konateibacter massiliensis]|uniref:DNA internalization-related competence protein ComEC/Rec2 n=1 Tax=Konateibacter massiliensis TaxID=2002841 RepID=UPI000C1521CC|nr:DNA internalization-related competence protein ComEC/Rec2 [Konateibacter massiliensis]
MSKRPLCVVALVYILAVALLLLIDTSGLASMPLNFRESAAVQAITDKSQVAVSGRVYKQELKNEQLALYLNQTVLYQNSGSVRANQIIVYTDIDKQIPIGYKINVTGTARKFQQAANPGQFNSYLYYKSLNIDFSVTAKEIIVEEEKENLVRNTLQKIRTRLSGNFDQITKGDTENGTFKAMVLGDTSEFTGSIKDLYQRGGILHIICISGSHIEIIGMFLFHMLRRFGLNYKISGGICIAVVICYGIMTGFGLSAYRAVIMFTIAMIAKMLGRTYDILSSLSLASILILMDNPLYIINIGFLLSFGAVIGIGAVSPVICQTFSIKFRFARDFISTLGVSIVTFPIILYSYYEFPIYSIFLNMIVIPISSLVLVSGILGCLCVEISMLLGGFMLGMGSYILKVYEGLCEFSLQLPYSSMVFGKPSPLQMIVYYLLLAIILYVMSNWKKKEAVLLFAAMLLVMTIRLPQGFWVTFLDVGQGDGIVIHSEKNTTFMIDGGSSSVKEVGKYRILPFLKSKGIRKLNYCIVTHPDSDHISGLMEIMQSDYKIENLILPQIGEKDEAYLELEELAKQSGISVLYIKKGDILQEGNLKLTCLHPYKEYVPESVNDYSTVLSLKWEELDMLFTGDLEAKGEEEVTKLLTKDYDILKVAHHGSKNSTSAQFLSRLGAEYAVISCGEKNSYGHPHKELLERLSTEKMNIMTTMDKGAITIMVEKNSFFYSSYRK